MTTVVGRLVVAGVALALAAGGVAGDRVAAWEEATVGETTTHSVSAGPAALSASLTGPGWVPLRSRVLAHPRVRRFLCHLASSEAVLVGYRVRTVQVDHGTVRATGGGRLVLEALDGRTLSLPVGPGARVFRDGRPAALEELEAGDVAFTLAVGGAARAVRAFDPAHDPCRPA
jgi:hypothetical protein